MLAQEGTKYVASWSREEQLNELTKIHRFNEIITGRVRSIITEQRMIEGKNVQADILVIALPNGATGYCAAQEYAIHQFKNTKKLVGRKASFLIKDILLDDRMLVLSGKAAQARQVENFWEEIIEHDKAGRLNIPTFKAEVTSYNPSTRKIHVRVQGQDCFINQRSEWSWSSNDLVDIDEGQEIEVKILRYDIENQRVEVSRRLALPNPFDFLEKLRIGDTVAGRVSGVDPQHGIFVQLENGLDVKSSKIKELDEPVVGDVVTCRVLKQIERQENGRIRGRVVIVGYPNGKRTRKDLGSFLFE